MSEKNSFSHLTLDERRIIEKGIENGSTQTAIAETLGKNKSTISKEISLHRKVVQHCQMPLECKNYRKCVFGRKCTPDCPDYKPFTCRRRDHSPGACNGCSNWSSCRFTKYRYIPETAQKEYEETLRDSREGVNLTIQEAKAIAEIVKPLVKQGQSPYQIVHNHPELGICEKTLYNYIDGDVLHFVDGPIAIDLRRKVSRKPSKKKSNEYKKREDRKYIVGRTFKDYQSYLSACPDSFVVQMDTVYNDVSSGPFIQTFKFLPSGLLFALFHDQNTASEMKNGVDLLERILGSDLFRKYVHVLLTDRGPEFSDPEGMERDPDHLLRTRVFYCDPMQSAQKGSLENKHIELRYILPKGVDLRAIGLTGQDKLNLALSHINSAPLEKFEGKSSLDLTEFLFPDLFQKLNAFGIVKKEKDRVILKPYLLK